MLTEHGFRLGQVCTLPMKCQITRCVDSLQNEYYPGKRPAQKIRGGHAMDQELEEYAMDQELEEYQGRQGKRQRTDAQVLSVRKARFETDGKRSRGARDSQVFVTRGHEALGEHDAAHFGTASSYSRLDARTTVTVGKQARDSKNTGAGALFGDEQEESYESGPLRLAQPFDWHRTKPKEFNPRGDRQEEYAKALIDHHNKVIIGVGPAGVGKTLFGES